MKVNKLNKRSIFTISIFFLILILSGVIVWLSVKKYSALDNNYSLSTFQQLQAADKPVFKPGHTLPRLSYWLGGGMNSNTQKELTENWGFSYGITLNDANWLGNPNSGYTKIAEMAVADPDRYPLHIITRHYWSGGGTYVRPESMWCHLDGVNGTPSTRVLSDEDGLTLSVALDADDMEVIVNKELSATLKTWFEWSTETFNRPASGWIRIENETMAYSSFTGNKFIISSRGAFGTTPAAHDTSITVKDKPVRVYSPEAPIQIFEETGTNWADPIIKFFNYYPTIKAPIIINGTEYGMGVIDAEGKMWKQDSGVIAARDSYNSSHGLSAGSWFDYISERKAQQETAISNALKAAAPNRDLYVHYGDSAGATRDYISGWGYDFKYMKPVTDLPAMEFYYAYGNTWNGVFSTLARKVGLQINEDRPLSYNFLSAGWRDSKNTLATSITADATTLTGAANWITGMPTSGWLQIDNEIIKYDNMVVNDAGQRTINIVERGVDGSTIPNTWFLHPTTATSHNAGANIYKLPQYGLSNPNIYMGFLKTSYVLGNIGSCQFYGIPEEKDPLWLWQFQYHSHAHALFSWLEDYIRNGDLLPGDGQNSITKSLPSYEFNTGDANAHVVARKKKDANEWLISAWVQSGVDRDVIATIPDLGTITLNARQAGSVYLARLNGQTPALFQVDVDALKPSQSASQVLNDFNILTPTLNSNRSFTYKPTATISGTKSEQITKIMVNNTEASIQNGTNNWNITVNLYYGSNNFTVTGYDASHNSSSKVINIVRRKVGDFNQDGIINENDFTLLLFNWGSKTQYNSGDFNEDDWVNELDFTALLYWWGK